MENISVNTTGHLTMILLEKEHTRKLKKTLTKYTKKFQKTHGYYIHIVINCSYQNPTDRVNDYTDKPH